MSVTSPTAAGSREPGGVDQAAFTALVAPLRRELHAHCYRMLGSVHDADDALQDTLLRAWRGLPGFQGRGSLRSWLYTVATRVCLDAVAGRARRPLPVDLGPASPHAVPDSRPDRDVAWLEPYPDAGLAAVPVAPDARYEQRESVELAFVAAVQHLPGNQRAALLLFDVLGYSAAEIAAMMSTSTTSVNSALARARRVLAARLPAVTQQRTLRALDDARLREIVVRYATALEDGDAEALVALLTEDVTWSMPPMPHWYRGIGAVLDFARSGPLGPCGSWRHLPVGANGQPALAAYLRRTGSGPYLPWSITVLTLRDGRIAELTSFLDVDQFAAFGLPAELPPGPGQAGPPDGDPTGTRA
ncbi:MULTISPECIES: sigma-70 family RNA polymerase sigma factor [Micromonospora]|uniref:Sigma-70 family RNA polymerase sigma factor n=1 Tax=Micromonospora solifontis TaxID=2487138 RepID=A0ABX9WE54_9ACTN|nr:MULTISPECIES: sigma-70 family RNA polymerase sigma factor [Micromonospora]NES12967.1 sigma-70 family RNA polymerase sigma factor [Micromonospora sp. PPF5-17B]NES38545.1 sigma-70 family RNA polymerase sigma factor [Micromonospora solifontis]NES54892.1 sigma-70 family RNA polymerase sigma factor [Micromonospora sp. PPF5-6]RNL95001.1 sigma-70 family RNA polymerase sigma factor [Micromonospora solifontis]